ncbi:fungal specific transcription factor domain-containing protein [Colletotrichum asianum]|uniref:Fungal specific transcription factor domain-containing protein n=1 Tax=Colletotrichum asianum TaxID=702518 RepID=A0A8H3ZT44_9PEZI|nr:fungal specific transcription factor domain-containing protein [Colletotrichum asianum]
MSSSWSHYAGLDGRTGSQRSRYDFRSSGDPIPPDLWDFDSTNSEEFFDINIELLDAQVEVDPDLRAQLPQNGEVDNSPLISPDVSASKTSARNLTNGKVSNIETLRGEGKNPDSRSHAVPPSIYIRQNETQGHHLAYFHNINATLPILDEDLFMVRAEMFYTHERIQLDIFDYCMFYLAISIGSLNDRDATSKPCRDADELSSTCYQQAWSIMLDSFAAPCEASVQILLLHVVYQLYFGRCGISWVFCGLAVRIAQSLGLHQRNPPDVGFSERRRAIRTRLWFLTFGLDANLSLSQGRSPGTSSEVFEKRMVIDHHPSTELEASPGFFDIVQWWLHRLSQVDQRLATWKEGLPVACRPEGVVLSPMDTHPHVFLLHIDYYNFLRTIHLSIVVMRSAFCNSEEPEPSRFQASEAICVEAARSFIKALNKCHGRYEYQDAYPSISIY